MRWPSSVVTGCIVTLIVVSGLEARATDDPIRAELERICRDIRASDQFYLGEGVARELERRLEDPPVELVDRVGLEGLLAKEYLKLGRVTESVALLDRALAAARRHGFEPPMLLPLLWNLGLAQLQAAEDANCVGHHGAASCILPISAEGRHRAPEHAAAAAATFAEYLGMDPQNIGAAWLLNLAHMVTGSEDEIPSRYRIPAAALAPEVPFEPWLDVATTLGVDAVDLAGGAVMDDFDGDGRLDLVSSTSDPCDSVKAFRNDGRGGFEEVTAAWGLDRQLGGLNLVHADYDDDGWLDLLVLRGGWLYSQGRIRNSLLRNRAGTGTVGFEDVTRAAGLAEPAYPTQAAAWADFDLDGDLDLFVANEIDDDKRPYPSQLFRNEGDGTFTDVAAAAGVTNLRQGKGTAWGDFDDDGDPDLYVSNIGPNRLYRNEGDGTFRDVAAAAGVVEPVGRSFASWFFDFDNDGRLDLFVADYGADVSQVAAPYFGRTVAGHQPRLYRNLGGRFEDVSRRMGLDRPLLPMGANHGDLDGDGWPDIYLGTGDPGWASLMPNVAYRNVDGRRFQEVTFAGRFGHLQKGHGVAFGDVDNDGDLDLFHQLGGFFPGDAYANALFLNPGSENHWIVLRLRGRGANAFGVDARIEVRGASGEGRRSVHALVGSGGSFGGSSFQQEIGLGDIDRVDELIVRWPTGASPQRFTGVGVDRAYEIVQGADALVPIELPQVLLTGRPATSPFH